MKRFIVLLFVLPYCFYASAQSSKIKIKTHQDSIAYTLGCNIGSNLKKNLETDSLVLDKDIIAQGIRDALNGPDKTLFTEETNTKVMAQFRTEMEAKMAKKSAKASSAAKMEGLKFLEENKTKPGITTTASGLQYRVITEGTGASPNPNSSVTVNYEGKFIDGKVFDSSYERNQPADFPLNGVIKGFSEALLLMKEGSIYEIFLPSDIAYGDAGNQGIPGGSTLIFKIELIKVK
ncbi:MAG TPA: FKBP-type peptidyl-prolyl cis-trans isomerase [Bacteroidales bacterium]|nr:FKBP-type peptidyl-prolyl cis-trans isomerase [Bacteroidales bacterium]